MSGDRRQPNPELASLSSDLGCLLFVVLCNTSVSFATLVAVFLLVKR